MREFQIHMSGLMLFFLAMLSLVGVAAEIYDGSSFWVIVHFINYAATFGVCLYLALGFDKPRKVKT